MKFLYKYPQAEFPYARLIEENGRRSAAEPEFELVETGVFDEGRYFDIVVEYAKASPEDLCIRIEAFNRGPEPAPLHILPHLWFRNTWAWARERGCEPHIALGPAGAGFLSLKTDDCEVESPSSIPVEYRLGPRFLYAQAGGVPLFTDNETNMPRVFGPAHRNRTAYVKDAFHRHLIDGEPCTNPDQIGTKAAIHYRFDAVPPGGSVVVRLRLSNAAGLGSPLDDVDATIAARKAEADEFYEALHPPGMGIDGRMIQRQALAGLLWNKQSYLFDVALWLDGDNPDLPPPASRKSIRNEHWRHLNSMRVMTVPDKWEYPWFAAWDLAFQCVAWPWSTPITPSGSSGSSSSTSSSTPTGRSRPMSGSSPTSMRRCTPGRSGGCTTWTASARGRPTATSSSAASTSCCSTSPGGSTRSTARGTTSSRAGSWAWTTSPSSTGARGAATAPASSNPTPRGGWGCSA